MSVIETVQTVPFSARLLAQFDRCRWWLLALTLIAYGLAFNGKWLIGPDSALYLALGRNIATGHGYSFRGSPQGLAYPGLPYALAGVYKLFGAQHYVYGADLFCLLCGLGALALTYRLMRLAFGRPTAVMVAFGVAFNQEIFRCSYQILTEAPFMLGVMAFLAGQEAIFHEDPDGQRHRHGPWDWTLLVGGLAIAMCCRPTMIGLLASWIIAMIWTALRKPHARRVTLLSVCVLVIALMLFLRFDPRVNQNSESYESWMMHELSVSNLGQLGPQIVQNVVDLLGRTTVRVAYGIQFGPKWLCAIFSLLVLCPTVALIRLRPLWGLWTLFILASLILLMSEHRYVLPIVPFIVLGWWRMLRAINLRLPATWANPVFMLLLVLGSGANIAQIGIFAVRQRGHYLRHNDGGRFLASAPIANAIDRFTGPNDLIIVPERFGRVFSYLADRDAYDFNELTDVGLSGRTFYVVVQKYPRDATRNGPTPQWLSDKHVTLVQPPLATVPDEYRSIMYLYRGTLSQ